MKKVILSMISTAVVSGFGIYCLLNGLLEGTESVVLILGGVFVGFIVYFSSEIQEFTIAGNAVKFKDLKNEAVQTIKELKDARTEIFRLLLPQTLKWGGGYAGSSKVDSRIQNFIDLYQKIEEFNCINDLRKEITESLRVLIMTQYNNLNFIHKSEYLNPSDSLERLWLPRDISIHLTDEMIQNLINPQGSQSSYKTAKEDIFNAIEAYTQLYGIYKKLE